MLKYAKIENAKTKVVSVGTGTNHDFYKSVGMTLMDVEQSDIDGQWYQAGYAPMKSEGQKQKEQISALKADYEATVEGWLAAFADTRGYKVSNMGAYANSTNPTFKAEALYYIEVQDRTWEACYEVLNAVLAGTRPVPTKEELYAELPVSTAQWPTPNPTAEQAAAI